MAIYAGMLGIQEMMEDDGFASFVIGLSDIEASRPAQEVWQSYCATKSVSVSRNEKALEA